MFHAALQIVEEGIGGITNLQALAKRSSEPAIGFLQAGNEEMACAVDGSVHSR